MLSGGGVNMVETNPPTGFLWWGPLIWLVILIVIIAVIIAIIKFRSKK